MFRKRFKTKYTKPKSHQANHPTPHCQKRYSNKIIFLLLLCMCMWLSCALYKLGIFTHKNSNHIQVYVLNKKKSIVIVGNCIEFFFPVENKPPFSWISTLNWHTIGSETTKLCVSYYVWKLYIRCVQTFNLELGIQSSNNFCRVVLFFLLIRLIFFYLYWKPVL